MAVFGRKNPLYITTKYNPSGTLSNSGQLSQMLLIMSFFITDVTDCTELIITNVTDCNELFITYVSDCNVIHHSLHTFLVCKYLNFLGSQVGALLSNFGCTSG